MKILFFVCVLISAGTIVSAQTKVVTNDELAKYRSVRVKAETDLRENYAKLGFSSPEERARRNEESMRELANASARIRAERAARERIDAERRAAEYYVATPRTEIVVIDGSPSYYYGGYYWPIPQRSRGYQQPGYFAGGQFWPTGSSTPPRPLISRPRN